MAYRESLNTNTQCTTSAVFHRMEEISCTMLTASMKHGLEVLDKKIKVIKRGLSYGLRRILLLTPFVVLTNFGRHRR